mgnify:CR=1 FL=1|tara:strand:- start:31287 stop:32570 length:1284 start_codon:yes stop_codon:yes gene_type:complete
MNIWLLQRNEPTPIDSKGKSRLFRMGIIAEMLSKSGHKVTWWTSDFDHYSHKFRFRKNHLEKVDDNYEIEFLKARGYKNNISLNRYLSSIDVANSFRKRVTIKKTKPDIIFASIPAVELAKEALIYSAKNGNIPVVLDIRDLWPDFLINSSPIFLKPLFYILTLPMRIKNYRVFSNAYSIFGLTDEFVNWGLKYAKRKKIIDDKAFPMAYIKGQFDKEEQEEEQEIFNNQIKNLYKLKKNSLIVTYVGNIGRNSDFVIILKAASILNKMNRNVQFVFAGDGIDLKWMKKQSINTKNIFFTGWINKTNIKKLLEISDLGLLPYKNISNYRKNLPNKPAEYLSNNLALLLSLDYGPIYNLIKRNNCGSSYSNDPYKLVKIIIEYLDKVDLLQVHKKNSKNAYENNLDGKIIYKNLINSLELISKKTQII